jgi:L-ascorbate metabolism protein UlaG (beta-lactamase superfamily)
MLRYWCIAASVTAAAAGAQVPNARPAADLQYLQISGWVVKTSAHVLVFDYVESLPGVDPLPGDISLKPEYFEGRRTMVFVSHGHADHFSPAVAEWSRRRPDIQYVVGWPGANLPGARVLKPRETWSSGGVVVKTTGSTDEGVGFLVTVDGLSVFHAGDHARWDESDDEAFQAEIRWLKGEGGTIDLAFFPIATGAACDPRPSIWRGVRTAALELQPRILIPMHVRCLDKLDLYERFRAEVSGKLGATAVVAPTRRGESFHYQAGKISTME